MGNIMPMQSAKYIVIAVIIIIIAAIGIYLTTLRPVPTTPTTTPTTSTTIPTTTPTTTTPTSTPTSAPTSPTPTTPTTTPTTTSTPTPTTTPTITPPTTTTLPSTPKEKITLVVLTRHPAEIWTKAKEAFLKTELAKKYGIVDIKFVNLPPGFWTTYIKERKEVDVAWGGGPTLFDLLYLEGLLAPLTTDEVLKAVNQIPDVIAGVPMKRIGPDGKIYWVAAAIASFGFTINKEVLNMLGLPTPKSWKDLASPELGKPLLEVGVPAVSIADPTQSTSNTRMYEIILQRYGWEEGWIVLTLLAANAEIYGSSSEARDAVIRGDVAVGITIDFYGYIAEHVNPNCKYIIPEGETIVNGDPIALVKTSRHPEASQAFIAWVLTEGQKIWLDPDINRLPSNPKVFETPEGAKRPDLKKAFEEACKAKAMKFNDTLALSYEIAMQNYFRAVLVELNDRLKEVWKKLLELFFAGKISKEEFNKFVKMLGEPLEFVDPFTGKKVKFTEEYAIKINAQVAKNIEAYRKAWSQAAIERFNKILEMLKALEGK